MHTITMNQNTHTISHNKLSTSPTPMSSSIIADIHRKGSIKPDQNDVDLPALDPALASCCAREIESNRKATQIDSILQRYDRVAVAERAKSIEKYTLNLSFGKGCRCCYDPNTDGGEYEALTNLKIEKALDSEVVISTAESINEKEERGIVDESESSPSDDEFDYLLDEPLPNYDEDRRLQELEETALYNASLEHHGFGVHRQMHPNRLLRAAAMRNLDGEFSPAVVHLFDPNSRQCAELDLILEDLGNKYRGTRFLRGNGRAVILTDTTSSQYLNLQVENDVPSLLAFKGGNLCVPPQKICTFSTRTNDINGKIIAQVVEQWLSYAGVLQQNAPPMYNLCRLKPEEKAFSDILCIETDNTESKEAFDCGIPGCIKHFSHEHVGIETTQQTGRLVSEKDVLGDPS